MCSIKDGNALVSVKEINWMGTAMITKGFGMDGASDTFSHKEYQHVLGEHIAQKGMLKHIWLLMHGHVCFCVLSVFCVFFLSPAFLTMHRQTWLHPTYSCAFILYEAFQHNTSTCAITSVWTASRGASKLKHAFLPCKLSIFPVYQSSLGLFIWTSINLSPSARHPENNDGLRAHCVLQMAASCPWLDFEVWGGSDFPGHIGGKTWEMEFGICRNQFPHSACEVLARKNN